MKRVLFVLLAILSIGDALAIDQIGFVYRYNGKNQRTPIGGVYIKVATSPNGVVSQEQDGQFVLKLKDIGTGDAMGKAIVQKTGMMVFNDEEVDKWRVQKKPLVLIVCDSNEFQKQKEQLIAIGRNQAEKKYKRQMDRLNAQEAKQQIDLEQYYEKLGSIEMERDNALSLMDEYADMFARIDESEIDTVAQKAMDLFRQGNLDAAIRLFEQGNYLKKIDDALKIKAQAARRQKADSAGMLADKEIEEYRKSIEAQVAAYRLSNEWDKAGALLKELADKLKTSDAIWDYAYFAQNQNLYDDAEDYLKLDIDQTKSSGKSNESKLIAYYSNLAELYSNTYRFTESEQMYQAALKVCKRLAEANPRAYEPYLAIGYYNLALVYCYTQRFSEGEQLYKSAVEIFKRIAEDYPESYESNLADSYNNLAILYKDTQRFTESEQMHMSALEIRKRLAETNPQTYGPDLAGSYNNLADFYSDTQRFTESEQMRKAALEICKHLADTDPQAYEPDLANSYNHLADLYSDTERFTESEQMRKSAMEIYKRLAEANPLAYEPDLAESYNNLGNLYYDTERFTECEQMYKSALEIRKRLAEINPQAYEPDLAESYYNLTILYYTTQRFTECEQMCISKLNIYKRLAEDDPQTYEHDLAVSYNDLAVLYYNTQRLTECEQMHKSALEIRKRLAEDDPQVYESHLVKDYLNVAYISILTKQFVQAEQYSIEALKVDSTQHNAYAYLAAVYLLQGKYADAEKIYRQYKEEFKEGFESSFEALAKAGVIPAERLADVEKIKKLLNE